jgi:ferritin-like metal-binding protein YciE
MFERFETSAELFAYKLGSALKMENTVVDMLDRLCDDAQSAELKQQLRHHQEETRQQIVNVERAFAAIGEEPDDHPDLVIEAIDKEGLMLVKRADDRLKDQIILAGAADTEHHEIAAYEWLITTAQTLGHQEVIGLLQENLQQEQHTLDEVRSATQQTAQRTAAPV